MCQDLGVRFPGAADFFPDTDNIVVGLAFDVEIQVECANTTSLSSNSGSSVWMYRNGTEVPRGLQPFGTSQGEGGVLRVYPASELRVTNSTEFICSSGGSVLNVTFILGGCGLGVVFMRTFNYVVVVLTRTFNICGCGFE